MSEQLNGVLGHTSAPEEFTGLGATWANEIYFGMNKPQVQNKSIVRPVDLQDSALPLCHGCPILI